MQSDQRQPIIDFFVKHGFHSVGNATYSRFEKGYDADGHHVILRFLEHDHGFWVVVKDYLCQEQVNLGSVCAVDALASLYSMLLSLRVETKQRDF